LCWTRGNRWQIRIASRWRGRRSGCGIRARIHRRRIDTEVDRDARRPTRRRRSPRDRGRTKRIRHASRIVWYGESAACSRRRWISQSTHKGFAVREFRKCRALEGTVLRIRSWLTRGARRSAELRGASRRWFCGTSQRIRSTAWRRSERGSKHLRNAGAIERSPCLVGGQHALFTSRAELCGTASSSAGQERRWCR
jgi:hypothetical protein